MAPEARAPMSNLGETIRLVELVCARLCHDLGGLIGTVGNAVDMVADDVGRDNEVLAFATSASGSLTQRLRLLRTAFGPDASEMSLSALHALTRMPLTARRIALDTRGLPLDSVFPPPLARVVLNLILLACDGLPRGGTVVLLGEPADLFVRIDGRDAAWPPGLAACLGDEAAAYAALTSVHAVQMPLTILLAISRKLDLSAVLAPGSGIQALRLCASQENYKNNRRGGPAFTFYS